MFSKFKTLFDMLSRTDEKITEDSRYLNLFGKMIPVLHKGGIWVSYKNIEVCPMVFELKHSVSDSPKDLNANITC
jgi:hypothetical protein